MKVTHVITGLDVGGAELMLYRLLTATDRTRLDHAVVSLTNVGAVGERIRDLGVAVVGLGMRPGRPDPRAVIRLASILRRSAPDAIQTWMYHADLIGGLAATIAGGIPVAWGIHHSNLSPAVNKRTTIWTARACARLSVRLPTLIVCCSHASLLVHQRLGYAAEKMRVIPNGFDLDIFKPDPSARAAVREELGLGPATALIGIVARFDPQKDLRNFVLAAGRLHAESPNTHFLMCGDGVTWQNPPLVDWVEAAGVRDRAHLLGPRGDIPRLQASLDVATSAAVGEAFPLVVGEAMACGVPCVVTDVGDSALIVGKTGRVVPPQDPASLAAAWRELLALDPPERALLGSAARHRIAERYSLPVVAGQYESLYREMVTSPRPDPTDRVGSAVDDLAKNRA